MIFIGENYYSINFKKLSDSAIGSFIKQKFKRSIIYENIFNAKIKLRYIWKFKSKMNMIMMKILKI